MKVKATVIIPTHNHGQTIKYSLESALKQSFRELEVFIIGDGVSRKTAAFINQLARKDKRVTFFNFPKGPGHGETYRHQVIKKATGKIICYLSDDDLWFKNHVQLMFNLLNKANLGHTLPTRVNPNGEIITVEVNLRNKVYQNYLKNKRNYFPLSSVGHTTELYLTLPFGWRTAPLNTFSDVHMWRQFFDHPKCKPANLNQTTTLHFPDYERKDWPLQKRLQELNFWSKKLTDFKKFTKFYIPILSFKSDQGARFKIHNYIKPTGLENLFPKLLRFLPKRPMLRIFNISFLNLAFRRLSKLVLKA